MREVKLDKEGEGTLFEEYSEVDVSMVREATRLGCALIGGTAVQMLARVYGVREHRERSKDDLDFLTSHTNEEGIKAFKYVLKKSEFVPTKMGDSEFMLNYENVKEGVEVDVLVSWEAGIEGWFLNIRGILVVNPIYLFLMKVQRLFTGLSNKDEADKKDLVALYDVIEKRGELHILEGVLSEKCPDLDEGRLNAVLNME